MLFQCCDRCVLTTMASFAILRVFFYVLRNAILSRGVSQVPKGFVLQKPRVALLGRGGEQGLEGPRGVIPPGRFTRPEVGDLKRLRVELGTEAGEADATDGR